MEQLLQGETGEPLQGGGEGHRAQKEQEQIARQRGQRGQDNNRPEAVDRTDRAVEKAPVDKFSRDQGGVAHLGTPAQKGVYEKHPDKTIQHNRAPFCAVFPIISVFSSVVQPAPGRGRMETAPPGQTGGGRVDMEQYFRLPQDVVGHDAALLSYWDTMPAKAQLRLLESEITVSTLGELKMLAQRFGE